MNKFTNGILILGFASVGFLAWNQIKPPVDNPALDAFAQCLQEKNVVMYGAEWCGHCQNQKKMFGSAFDFVKYVECPQNIQLCLAKGVSGYPTWLFPDGKKLEGEQSLEALSKLSRCTIIKEN